jgi:hypothetical protein
VRRLCDIITIMLHHATIMLQSRYNPAHHVIAVVTCHHNVEDTPSNFTSYLHHLHPHPSTCSPLFHNLLSHHPLSQSPQPFTLRVLPSIFDPPSESPRPFTLRVLPSIFDSLSQSPRPFTLRVLPSIFHWIIVASCHCIESYTPNTALLSLLL